MTKSPMLADNDTDFIEQPKKSRKSSAGRKLMRWDPSIDQLVLLYIDYLSVKKSISIPWDEVAAQLNDYTTGEGIKQHLAKVRNAREREGRPNPPKVGGRKRNGVEATEGATAKAQDISKRSSLLYYPEERKSKQKPGAENHLATSKEKNATKTFTKTIHPSKMPDTTERRQTADDNSDAQTADNTQEAGRGKKRGRGTALEKEIQELTGVHEGPLKRQMITKLRAREPVNYSELEMQEAEPLDDNNDDSVPELHSFKIEPYQGGHQGDGRSHEHAGCVPFASQNETHSSDYSNGRESNQLQSDSTIQQGMSSLGSQPPLITQPSLHPHFGQLAGSHMMNYSMSFTESQPFSKPPANFGADVMMAHPTNTSVNMPATEDVPPYSLQAALTRVNRGYLSQADGAAPGFNHGRTYVNHTVKPAQTMMSLLASQVKPLRAQQVMIPDFSEEYRDPAAGYTDPDLTRFAMKNPKFDPLWSIAAPEQPFKHDFENLDSPAPTINPFDIHKDPSQAHPDYADIMKMQASGIMPMRGEPPGAGLLELSASFPVQEPVETDFDRYKMPMQSYEDADASQGELKLKHQSDDDSEIAEGLSNDYNTKDWELFGFKISDIHPIEVQGDAQIGHGTMQMANHSDTNTDTNTSTEDPAQQSDSDVDLNMEGDDLFADLMNDIE